MWHNIHDYISYHGISLLEEMNKESVDVLPSSQTTHKHPANQKPLT